MNLKEYFKLERGRAWNLAKAINCGASTISMIIANKRRPSPSLALRIERATGGVVTRDELLFPELYLETPATPTTAQDAL